ncbi:MAG: hypothetical protein WBY93_15265 [Candidatus Binatus sp.]
MAPPRNDAVSADLSAGANKLCLFAGLTAGLAYSTFASFVANALTPVSGRLIEADSFRRVVSGRYVEVFSLDGAIPTLIASLIVFVLVWTSMRLILEHWQREDWKRLGTIDRSLLEGPLLIPVTIARPVSALSK